MKTKDNLLKGIIIGVCVVVIPLLTMGLSHNSNEGEVGTYQISTTMGQSFDVYETIINTMTGEVVKRKRYSKKYYPERDEWEFEDLRDPYIFPYQR